MASKSVGNQLRRAVARLLCLSLALAVSACAGRKKEATSAPDPKALAKRVGNSFFRCIENSGASCVENQPEMIAWDAVALLAWMYEASPVSVLGALNGQLAEHAQIAEVQKRFVRTAQKARLPSQGAGCRSVDAHAVEVLLARLVPAVEERFTHLGMYDASMKRAVQGLAKEAEQGMGVGHLVEMSCSADASLRWYAAVTKTNSKFQVVGLTVNMPEFVLGKQIVELELRPKPKGVNLLSQGGQDYVDRWVDLEWEAY